MAAANKNHLFRSVIVGLLIFLCGSVYYCYLAMRYEAYEFKDPAGPRTAYFAKHKYVFDLKALPLRMSYYLLAPEPLYSDVKYPLLVVLHGGTGKAYAAGFMAESYYREKYPGFILVPVTPVNHIWHTPHAVPPPPYKNALPYVIDLVKELSDKLPIDKGRVYVVGCSMGGGGSIAASLYYQNVFAAAAAMGSYFIPEYLPETLDTPLAILHGRLDRDAPVEAIRATVSIIQKAGGPVYYSEFENGGHNCPAEYFYPEALWDWLYSQSKPHLRY